MESQNVNKGNGIVPVKEKTKHFAGKTVFKLDYSTTETLSQSKTERHFYQRMLRAYLKGKDYFNFGYEYTPHRQPIRHKVLVEYK